MKGVTPAIVTHPCTLFRDGLRQILAGTQFRLIHIVAELDEATIRQLSSKETCLWLMGVEECDARTCEFVRRVKATTLGVKPVILAKSQTTENVLAALEAGASGFLFQDICCERLIKSLELIALGETVVPAEFLNAMRHRMLDEGTPASEQQSTSGEQQSTPLSTLPTAEPAVTNGNALATDSGTEHAVNGKNFTNGKDSGPKGHAGNGEHHSENDAAVIAQSLSRRETSILLLLMEGASNKVIARSSLSPRPL